MAFGIDAGNLLSVVASTITGMIFGGPQFKTIFGNDFGTCELHANLSENHEWTNTPTIHPVEEGAAITDHIIEEPDELTLTGFISNTPFFVSDSLAGIFGSIQGEKLTQGVFDFLDLVRKAKAPVVVYTRFKIYEPMWIKKISIPRSYETGDGLEFTIDFIKLRIVETKFTDIPPGISQKKTAKKGKKTQQKTDSTKNAGNKNAEEVKNPSGESGSILYDKLVKKPS